MTSWVYVFSRFTPEALLFEALLICILLAGYTAFWVLKKRKLGPLGDTIPTGVVKTYLNELIVDAEKLRAQLFGLLASGDSAAAMQIQNLTAPMGGISVNPALAQQLAVLEAKMNEQSSAMASITQEKDRLEKELQLARTKTPGAGGAAVDSKLIAEMEAKIRSLESKLAEYSVIEDDLANLKRLQQENTQLKAALAGKAPLGGLEAAVVAPVAAAVAEPVIAAAPAPTPAPPLAEEPSMNDVFEGLVTDVEKSLQSEASTEPATGATVAAAITPSLQPEPTLASTPAPEAAAAERSDADLVAEFEKMLNG